VKQISAVVITYNEEDKIEACLESLADLCEDIVVLDSFSTDSTVELSRRFTERVVQEAWRGYARQKQLATDFAEHEWVLSLDADEKLSSRLRQELMDWKAKPDDENCNSYRIPRLTFFMGRWIRHTTWYPDWQVRLFRRSKAQWQGGNIHEGVIAEGGQGKFSGHLLHYTYSSISEYLVQLENFSSLAAIDYHSQGKKVGVLRLVFAPPGVFLKNWFARAGFRDGIPGFVVAVLASVSTFFKYLKLWELQGRYGTRKPSWKKLDDS
jgi:glycosyltransferase involved in cell wall biosynthesis